MIKLRSIKQPKAERVRITTNFSPIGSKKIEKDNGANEVTNPKEFKRMCIKMRKPYIKSRTNATQHEYNFV